MAIFKASINDQCTVPAQQRAQRKFILSIKYQLESFDAQILRKNLKVAYSKVFLGNQ